MRNVLAAAVLLSATTALAAPDFHYAAFEEAIAATDNSTLSSDEGVPDLLLKRQGGNTCATSYRACDNLNAPGLCCPVTASCSADAANHVACCPFRAVCTGTIVPWSPPSAIPTTTGSQPFATIATTTTETVPLAPTASGSFVQSGTGSGRSLVPNEFYPFPAIPTTYTNAAACSRAYTTCSQDAQACTSALALGVPGVTVSGPNGGATITSIASLGQASAAAICSSLSSRACSGLVVEACGNFGGDSGAGNVRCGVPLYGVGAGVAVGIAGQLLR